MSLILLDSSVLTQETRLWLSFLPTRPSDLTIKSVNNFIRAAKSHGYWNLFDRFNLFAQDKQANAVYSIKNPTSTPCTEVNSPSWVAYRGYSGNGSSSYVNSNTAPSTGINFTQDLASFGLYSITNSVHTGVDAGTITSTNTKASVLRTRFTGDVSHYRINESSVPLITAPANNNSTGLFGVYRTGSTATEILRNGVSLGTSVYASDGLSTVPFYIGALNIDNVASQFTDRQISLFYTASGSLPAMTFYNDFNTYLKTPLGI